jgi:hypothetical protein
MTPVMTNAPGLAFLPSRWMEAPLPAFSNNVCSGVFALARSFLTPFLGCAKSWFLTPDWSLW